jgi:bacterial/archaeal transporter family protein
MAGNGPAEEADLNTWWMFALASSFFAALTAIFAKIGIKNVDPDLATAIRTAVILVIAWSIVLFRGVAPGMGSLPKRSLLFIVISGVATGLSWIFYFRALQLGKVTQVTLVDRSSLALTVLFAVLFLGESISWRTAFGAGFILVGVLTLARG